MALTIEEKREKAKKLTERAYGKAPTFSGIVTSDMTEELIRWYNFHNETTEIQDNIKYLKSYLTKNNYNNIQNILNSKMLTNNICVTAKLIELYVVDQALENRFEKKIKKLIPLEIQSATQRKKRSRSDDLIADFDSDVIDCIIKRQDVPSIYEWLNTKQAKAIHAKDILEYILPQYENEISKILVEDVIYEGYNKYTKKQISDIQNKYKDTISDLKSFITGKKRQRKPRKTKPTKIRLDKLKYKKEDLTLKVTSIDPKLIIGANSLWVFNTKYNIITHYRSEVGLSIKGTTLTNFTEESCSKRAGRQSPKIVQTVLTGGKVELRKLMETIKGTGSVPKGRINEDIILLRVVK